MSDSGSPHVEKLSRVQLAVADLLGDVRGRALVTADGEHFGEVGDLLIDRRDRTIRFLEVTALAHPGSGRRREYLVPRESVSRVDEGQVAVSCSSDTIAAAPVYNPHIVQTDLYLSEVYEHFGFSWPGLAGPGLD